LETGIAVAVAGKSSDSEGGSVGAAMLFFSGKSGILQILCVGS
jgi:hypothetical protein